MSDRELVAAARRMRRLARAPYSGFTVGAALETREGVIVTGCNLENASYGLTMCAERVAMFKALSDGYRRFRRMAIATGASTPTPPCGACRQVLWEYAGDLELLLVGTGRTRGRYRLAELLPLPFDDSELKGSRF